jgi:hypothetical protein
MDELISPEALRAALERNQPDLSATKDVYTFPDSPVLVDTPELRGVGAFSSIRLPMC